MKPHPHLTPVPDEPQGEIIRDLQQRMRVEIAARDWSRCHIEGDKRAPVEIGERRKGWRG